MNERERSYHRERVKNTNQKKEKHMKKRMRTLFAFMLTCIMVLCMNMVVLADDPITITVKKAANDKAPHTYEVYQVFSGTLTTETVSGQQVTTLTEIQWGSGVNGAALLTALKGDSNAFTDCESAADVAKAIQTLGEPYAEKFASIVSTCLKTGTTAHQDIVIAADATSGTLSNVAAGYYFICDKADSLQDNTGEPIENAAYTKFILKVVKSVEVDAKTSVPTLDKKIVQPKATGTGTEEVQANTASIGDDVNFRITTAVPNTAGYDKYFFVIKDKLSPGLTFKADSLKVYQGADSTLLTKDTDYSVKTSNNNTIFEVVLKGAKDRSGKAIVVEYSATLNENADRTVAGNPNTADLIFSNNPNVTSNGDPLEPDYPGPNDVTGKTPEVKTITYTTGIKLIKIDRDTRKTLTGAKFKINGEKVNTVLTTAEEYTKDAAGTFYKLKDGTYTEEAPTAGTEGQYASTTDLYKREKTTTKATSTGTHECEATVDANGYLTFEGLGAGTYTITEVEAPTGYTPVAAFNVAITATPSLTEPGWKVDGTAAAATTTNPTIIKTYEVENVLKVDLPETGGMGTTVFYIIGGILVVLAGALLFAKLRMKKKDE